MNDDRPHDRPAYPEPRAREDLRDEPAARSADADRPAEPEGAGPDRARHRRAWIAAALVLVLLAAGAGAWWVFLRGGEGGERQAGQGGPRTVAITAAEATAEAWQPRLTAVGTVEAYREVMVTTQVPGLVEDVRFESGARVKTGEVLVMLDSDRDQAELRGLRAEMELARVQLARRLELADDGYAPEAEVDQAQARFQRLRAQLDVLRERIDDKTITAPFAGELGIRRLNEGSYIQPGQPVVTLAQLDPLRVIFSLPQEQFAKVETGQPVALTVSAWPDRTFRGTVTAVDPVLSRRTRSVTVEARIDNADRALRPGMFSDVALRLPERQDVVTLPQSAISYNPYGDFVFLIEEVEQAQKAKGAQGGEGEGEDGPALVARRTFITAGERRGTQIAIPEGVEAGQRVATSGLFKLRDGARVRIDNSVTPPGEAEVRQAEY